MKYIIKIARILVISVAIIFGLLAFGILLSDGFLVDRIFDFIILFLPGSVIMFAMLVFKNDYKVSGIIYFGIGMIYFLFFRLYIDFSSRWPFALIIVLPLMFAGFIHMKYRDIEKHIMDIK